LLGFLNGPEVHHPILSVPVPLPNQACAMESTKESPRSRTTDIPFESVVRSKPVKKEILDQEYRSSWDQTYSGHGTLEGRRPERRGRLLKWLRDRDGVATA
jgi:hypothetical protein